VGCTGMLELVVLVQETEPADLDIPLGDNSKPWVRAGNHMLTCTVIVCALAWLLQCNFSWEHPLASLVNYVPCVQNLLQLPGVHITTNVFLGCFGAPTPKPLKLLNSCQWAPQLRKPFPKGLGRLVRIKVVNGKKRVTGIKSKLKDSQAYPRGFGEAVVNLWLEAYENL